MRRIFIAIFPLLLFTSSCSIEPEPIYYGEDNCAHCEMTIMDQRYGTEIVTSKGKVYKFDSVECLVEFLENLKNKKEKPGKLLVTPFDHPGNLVNAGESFVLHSKNLPSPMGLYLSAFETEAAAGFFQDQYGGKIYNWDGLMEHFDMIKLAGR